MSEFKVGKINKKIIHSDILNRDVTLSIYLPEDYTNLFKYQLIFCFDGLDFLDLVEYNASMNSYVKSNQYNVQL